MGRTDIAQKVLKGVKKALGVVGDTKTLRIINKSVLDPDSPTADQSSPPPTDENIEMYMWDYEEKYINGTTVKTGDKKALIDLVSYTGDPKNIDFVVNNTDNYKVIKVDLTEFAGINVSAVLHLRK